MLEPQETQQLVGKHVYRKKSGRNTTYLVVAAYSDWISLKPTHAGGRFTYKSTYNFLRDYEECESHESFPDQTTIDFDNPFNRD